MYGTEVYSTLKFCVFNVTPSKILKHPDSNSAQFRGN